MSNTYERALPRPVSVEQPAEPESGRRGRHADGGSRKSRRLKRLRFGWVGAAAVLLVGVLIVGYSLNSRPPAVAQNTVQRGFALPTWQEDGYDSYETERNVREMAGIGTTWVQFNPTWYQDNRYTSEINRTERTVSDGGLERAITLAHQYGLKVFLKPHIDLPVAGQDSRNNIRPNDPDSWFANYAAFIGHYAEMAERMGVEQFAVGTELSSTTGDVDRWLTVIRGVRDVYHGTLVYAANGKEYARLGFWDAVDLIGIDGYWSLGDAPNTDVQSLEQAWTPIKNELAALSAKHERKVLFTESGFTSQQGTITNPSDWKISEVPSQDEQAAGYQALLATFSDQPWWAGVYWWVWNTPPDPSAGALDYSPRGKAAEWVVRGWWSK